VQRQGLSGFCRFVLCLLKPLQVALRLWPDNLGGFPLSMLLVSQLRLPIDHSDADLRRETAALLGLPIQGLESLHIEQRAIDARRGHVHYTYTLKVGVQDEARVLKKAPAHVVAAPDDEYRQL